MKRLLLLLALLGPVVHAAVDLSAVVPAVALKDGRVLTQVRIVGYSEHVLVAKWDGGRGTLAYDNLPTDLAAAIEQAQLRPIPKPPPPPPELPPAPIVPAAPPEPPTTRVENLKPGTKLTLHGRRQGSQIFLRTKVSAGGKQYVCECLVDTGATFTTIAQAQLPIEVTGRHEFTTANGQIVMPFVAADVTVGDISKEVGVALSPGLRVNLIGANFFEDFVYTIDLENSAIYLLKR